MTKNQVMALEYVSLKSENTNSLVYTDVIAGADLDVVYAFVGNKLSQGTYQFVLNDKTGDDCIKEYLRFKTLLTGKYGASNTYEINGLMDQYDLGNQTHGDLLLLGKIDYIATWETENTSITFLLKQVDGEVKMELDYETINLKRELERIKNQTRLNGL